MNKRGLLMIEIGLWLMRIMLVIIILAGVALQIRTYINTKVNMNVAEPVLIAQVLGASPAIIQPDDSGSRLRTIHVERFAAAEPSLGAGFDYTAKRHAAAKLTLLENDYTKEIAAIYLNKDYYQELAPQVSKLLGKTLVREERRWPVLLVEKGIERQGILRVEVLQPR